MLLGYLAYDTAFSLVMFPLRSGAVMLAHHVVGLAGCVIGERALVLQQQRRLGERLDMHPCACTGIGWWRGTMWTQAGGAATPLGGLPGLLCI